MEQVEELVVLENKGSEDSYTASPLNGATPITVSAQTYPITVGGGGAKELPQLTTVVMDQIQFLAQ